MHVNRVVINRAWMQPINALRMLVAARKGLTGGQYHALQRKLLPYLKHTTHLALPYTLAYPVPMTDRRARTHLCKQLHDKIRRQLVTAPLCAYYMAILTVPLTTGSTIKSAIFDNYVTASLETMQHDLRRPDQCACVTHTTCQHSTLYGAQEVQNVTTDQFRDSV